MKEAYLLLGTNQGDKKRNLATAISLLVTELANVLGSDIKESSIHESEPWGFDSDENFLNQAISFRTSITPHKLLEVCKYVEKKMGRINMEPSYDDQGSRIYHSRIIDIDILLFGAEIVDTPDLIIPHKELKKRDFAKIPLSEIIDESLIYLTTNS